MTEPGQEYHSPLPARDGLLSRLLVTPTPYSKDGDDGDNNESNKYLHIFHHSIAAATRLPCSDLFPCAVSHLDARSPLSSRELIGNTTMLDR